MNWMERWIEDYEPSLELAGEHARKALALGPEIGIVQVAYAEYLIFSHEYEKSLAHVDKALAINPNDADALATKSLILVAHGDYESALEVAEIGCRLDPYHTWCDWSLAEAQFFMGRYEDALHTIANSKNAPGFIRIYNVAACVKLGKMDQAREALQEFIKAARKDMFAMPKKREEWVTYTANNAPYEDRQINEQLIDYLVQAGLDEELAKISPVNSPDQHPTILVLPFSNLSGDPEQEYFSDGITASIMLGLGLFSGLTVKFQQSSFAFKNSDQSSAEIARDLGVDFLIEGSIRKSGERVRVSVQLIEAETDSQIWGKQFNEKLEDILELEQELSQTIAATISGRIGHEFQQSAVRKPAKNLQSYDYLMRGLYHFGKFTAQDFVIAKCEIEKCIEIDPKNATAHTNLGMIHHVENLQSWTSNHENSEKLASHYTEVALELDPDDALVNSCMAELLCFHGEYERSEFYADRAIELSPTASEGYMAKADLLQFCRRIDEAIPFADQGLKLDPHSVGAGWVAGNVYMFAGQYDKANKTFRSISHPPDSIHAQIAACLIGQGSVDDARKEMRRYLKLAKEQMPNFPTNEAQWRTMWRRNQPFKYDEDFDAIFDLLLQAGLCDEAPASADDIPSIAVLPFENMSGDPEQEYFSDGITNDIVTMLSHDSDDMRVVARHSTLAYTRDSKTNDCQDIATEEQGVRYILDGSVSVKAENEFASMLQLIDSQYRCKIAGARITIAILKDIFAVQDEITPKIIAVEMQVHLLSMGTPRAKLR